MQAVVREYRVHHTAPDSVLVQLPGSNGFGRLTKATLGGDILAERLLRSFAAREHVPAILRRTRDAQGYRLLGVNLHEMWSTLYTYPLPVRQLVAQLFRKHLLVGLGTTTVAQIVKSSEKGALLQLSQHMAAVATLEKVETEGSASHLAPMEVRVLNYDTENHVANVTTQSAVVGRTPVDTMACAEAFSCIHPGDLVEGRVLLSCTDDGCAVVEVYPNAGEKERRCSVLGYFIYNWPTGTVAAVPASAPVVGAELRLRVEFTPEESILQDVAPFVILSQRESFAELPATRRGDALRCRASTSGVGLMGYMPWRQPVQSAGHFDVSDSEDEDGSSEADRHSRIRRRKMEEAIDTFERTMDKTIPTSPEEFQRLLLANPNSSYLWTQYMAHHVGLQQYEEARQVAEKALTTIGVREQEERLNVWVAYMNVENLYGTAESLSSVFKRALRRQLDPLALHERLADIFSASRKPNQLLALCRTMVSKFRNERKPWERLGIVLVDQDKRDQLKRMIKDMGDALKKEEAAMTVVHIAIHEYKHGSIENGRALFEGLIAKSPKKSDVWSTYVDQELGLLNRRAMESSVTYVRQIFERAVAMNYSAKVMQQFLTRFLSFENAFGSPADVERVKERARAYVDAKIHAATGINTHV